MVPYLGVDDGVTAAHVEAAQAQQQRCFVTRAGVDGSPALKRHKHLSSHGARERFQRQVVPDGPGATRRVGGRERASDGVSSLPTLCTASDTPPPASVGWCVFLCICLYGRVSIALCHPYPLRNIMCTFCALLWLVPQRHLTQGFGL